MTDKHVYLLDCCHHERNITYWKPYFFHLHFIQKVLILNSGCPDIHLKNMHYNNSLATIDTQGRLKEVRGVSTLTTQSHKSPLCCWEYSLKVDKLGLQTSGRRELQRMPCQLPSSHITGAQPQVPLPAGLC